ncbi:winged helix-turn-helix transcriptional regulator [Frondihabitans australicus]|uniref:HxlR family transcriptional regulator n=1 Tax=Frondihabitans australicus TaxID=386892 RepID=A0A495IEJ0_9MICO|nr:helix-turn-helix domain-containing protein [Frondihabitans australicus]RKR74424.1 HxlR family transcriptional regulator [Frondihabitans australicus]
MASTATEREHLEAHDRIMRSLPTMSKMCTSHDPGLFRSLLGRIGDKWTLLVIGILGEKPHRFTELADIIPGISRRMLTVTLRGLERDGLVERTVYAEVPPRVVYDLSDLGRSLQEVVITLGDWVREHQEVISEHRARFDERTGAAPDA